MGTVSKVCEPAQLSLRMCKLELSYICMQLHCLHEPHATQDAPVLLWVHAAACVHRCSFRRRAGQSVSSYHVNVACAIIQILMELVNVNIVRPFRHV